MLNFVINSQKFFFIFYPYLICFGCIINIIITIVDLIQSKNIIISSRFIPTRALFIPWAPTCAHSLQPTWICQFSRDGNNLFFLPSLYYCIFLSFIFFFFLLFYSFILLSVWEIFYPDNFFFFFFWKWSTHTRKKGEKKIVFKKLHRLLARWKNGKEKKRKLLFSSRRSLFLKYEKILALARHEHLWRGATRE